MSRRLIALFMVVLAVFITCRKVNDSRMAVYDQRKAEQVVQGKHADWVQKLKYDSMVAASKARDDSAAAVAAARAQADSALEAEIMMVYQNRRSLTALQARQFYENDEVYYEVRDSVLKLRGLKPPT